MVTDLACEHCQGQPLTLTDTDTFCLLDTQTSCLLPPRVLLCQPIQLALPEIWSVLSLTNYNSFLSRNLQIALVLWQTTVICNESSPEGMSS